MFIDIHVHTSRARDLTSPNPHLPTDTLDMVDPENIQAAATLGIAFLDCVQKHQLTNRCS